MFSGTAAAFLALRISVTRSVCLAVYNLFSGLLQILMALMGERE